MTIGQPIPREPLLPRAGGVRARSAARAAGRRAAADASSGYSTRVNTATVRLPGSPTAIPASRSILTAVLQIWQTPPAQVHDAALLVTELTANAV